MKYKIYSYMIRILKKALKYFEDKRAKELLKILNAIRKNIKIYYEEVVKKYDKSSVNT